MDILVYPEADNVARSAAKFIAEQAAAAIEARGHFLLAVSGGSTPWRMLTNLSTLAVEWEKVHLMQVDERVAPLADAARNWRHIKECLSPCWSRLERNAHPMPVEAGAPDQAARLYADEIAQITGSEPIIDLVHLGLGDDGHTASLVPGDRALAEMQSDVTVAGPYQGHLRLTLTFAALNRARQRLWVVTGEKKHTALNQFLHSEPEIPASWVKDEDTLVMVDNAAMAGTAVSGH